MRFFAEVMLRNVRYHLKDCYGFQLFKEEH